MYMYMYNVYALEMLSTGDCHHLIDFWAQSCSACALDGILIFTIIPVKVSIKVSLYLLNNIFTFNVIIRTFYINYFKGRVYFFQKIAIILFFFTIL